jgi:hypothetical protein
MTSDQPGNADEDAERAAWHRRFAGMANNRGWALAEQPVLDAADRRALLYAAYAAAHHWDAVGTEVHAARAELLLARAHALNGDGELATHYAARAFAVITGADGGEAGEPWEVAFAHAAVAEAAAARGDGVMHARFHASAKALGDGLADPDDHAIFRATFDRIPVPAAGSPGAAGG